MITLVKLLRAERPDLLDGFPFKAAFKALTAEGSMSFKQAYINELLDADRIEVSVHKAVPATMAGFKEAGIIGAMTYSDGSIEVKVDNRFFTGDTSPFDRALRFQSIMAHELVHRRQFRDKTLHAAFFKDDDQLSSIEYLNDPYELQAMAAEVAHDVLTAQYSSQKLSQPRFNELSANARHITPEAMTRFRDAVTALKS